MLPLPSSIGSYSKALLYMSEKKKFLEFPFELIEQDEEQESEEECYVDAVLFNSVSV